MKRSEPPIVVEQWYPVPRQAVWNAVTDHSRMVVWYLDNIPEFRAIVGFELKFPSSVAKAARAAGATFCRIG